MPEPLAEIELPIIREIGRALYAAAVAIDERDGIVVLDGRMTGSRRARRSASRAKRRLTLHGPMLLLVALLCAGALVLGGLALAGVLGAGIGITPQQWLSGMRATPPTAITVEQSTHLAILRRPRMASQDAISADDVALLSQGTFRYAAGAELALSRRVRGLPSGAAWIVPGAGRICLMAYAAVDAQDQPAPGTQATSACAPDRSAISGHMVLLARDSRFPGVALLAGMVPDDISRVIVGLLDGRRITLAVHENTYLAQLHGEIAWTSFVDPHGPVTMRSFRWTPLQRRLCYRRGMDSICTPRSAA